MVWDIDYVDVEDDDDNYEDRMLHDFVLWS